VLEEVVLSVDEFEAIRLADLEGFYQELAAKKMSVSRQTFGRILESAHRKVAEALVRGKALKIEGGETIMKVGFAVQTNEGIESQVFNHFGSAPVFIIVDAVTEETTTVDNQDLNHVHGACNPIKALNGQRVDAMVVGGIGAGALSKLNAMGIKVYGSAAATVRGNLSLLKAGKLLELFPVNACRGHEGGCGH
jgi:ArsR family transcriptional regulator